MLQRRTPLKRTAFKPRDTQAIARELSDRAEELSARRDAMRKALIAGAPRVKRGVMARISSAVVSIPKEPRDKCAHLLAMAKGAPCLFWFVAGCRRDYDTGEHCTTVKAHDNRLGANKGKGLKAHDWRSLDACEPCHTAYDQGRKHTREQKNAAYDEAYARQLAAWRVIAADPTAKPKDRAAAQWAVERYENNERTKGGQ